MNACPERGIDPAEHKGSIPSWHRAPHWKMADEEFAKCDELLILGGNRSANQFIEASGEVHK